MNAGTKTCEHCGKPIGPKAVGGLCPECLMKVGLGSGTGPEGKPAKHSVAPPILEVAKHFPQLEIIQLLGEGGMGAVYKARQIPLDRLVALKILPLDSGKDPGFAERFTREARALAKLNHPNIVSVFEFGQVNGLHYFIMEYVDGINLRQLEQSGKLSARQALQIISQICEALQFAHDESVVHRDIKPENVLLDKKGRVKIADFGLAKILGREPEALRLTGAKDFMGTPHYMAPEQVEKPQTVDHRADIYSLGVVFYEMLTGELPLGRFQPPSKKVEVDVRLDEVVLHALEKEPGRRYQRASQVKTDLETIAMTPPSPQAPLALTDGSTWQIPILLVGGLISTAILLAVPFLPPPASWIALLFGLFGAIVAGIKLAGLWPFPSPLFPASNFTSRNLRRSGTTPPGTGSRSRLRTAAKVGFVIFVVIFGAATVVTLVLPHGEVERAHIPVNLGIGFLIAAGNGLLTGLFTFAAITILRRFVETGGLASPESPSHGPGSRAHYNSLELAIITLGTIFFVVFLFITQQLPYPLAQTFLIADIFGLTICALSIAGFWPFPSVFRRPDFSSRNLPGKPTSLAENIKYSLARLVALWLATITLTELAIYVSGHWRESDQERWFIPFVLYAVISTVCVVRHFFRSPRSFGKSVAGVIGVCLSFATLWAASDFYGNSIVPRFVHPEIRQEMEASFGRSGPLKTDPSNTQK